jgi:ubiquinone/menaquinone biosynthesis C-methylase UbiE
MGRVLEPEVMEGDDEAAAYDEMERLWGDIIFQGFAESALTMGVDAGRVLDVGTGSGRPAIRLARLNPHFQLDAIDLSESMLALARRNAADAGVSNITFSLGDAKHLPFADHTFDLVVCHQFLHQLPHPEDALREINRVAKPEGAILVRDVRRLPEPLMTLALPLWCLGYGPKLREQTIASFRAGLTANEFAGLIERAGIRGASVRHYFQTHQGIERAARPFRVPAVDVRSDSPLITRALKSLFVRKSSARQD